MVEGGDQDRHSLNMIHANVELILEHTSSLIAHTSKRLFPLVHSLRGKAPESPERNQNPGDDPSNQHLPPKSLAESNGAKEMMRETRRDLESACGDLVPEEAHLIMILHLSLVRIKRRLVGIKEPGKEPAA